MDFTYQPVERYRAIMALLFFYAPVSKDRGHIVLLLSICLSVRPSCLHKLTVKTTFSHYSLTNLLTRLTFGMKAYFINMHLLVPRSRSSATVKVKYKGFISQKMAVSGAFMFHKHILFLIVIGQSFYI